MRLHVQIFAGISLILLSRVVVAQQNLPDQSLSGRVNSTAGVQRGIVNSRTNRDQPGRYIVKFIDPPLTLNKSFVVQSAIQASHDRFISDLSTIDEALKAKAAATPPTRVLHEYKRAFNGFAVMASSSVKAQLEKLPYVAHVVEDKQVKTVDVFSNRIINAPLVWLQVGATGKNVRICIIDTGIDYRHQDLGHGFGAGFKVAGGYDFVNADNDPMDDNGHGTHVAGIAAANGPGLQGVAPDAKLYAYKALDADGSGLYSWIIAAIEKTIDPDGNPNTDDAMDVVNMSLGGPVDPTEPISEAVNNAVAHGIVYAVAAGNEGGSGYQTILTPGIAKDAITVGASSISSDLIPSFSSKGPTLDYRIKPDVAAPGVSINSSTPGNTYSDFNGTSMAAPHVAGAAALILEAHPDWAPQTVKSALMGTAVKTADANVWNNGSGRIDVLKAIRSTFVLSPASISLGVSDFSLPQWVQTKKITLQNVSGQPKVMGLSATGEALATGVKVAFSRSIVEIPASGSVEVTVIFTVNVNALPSRKHLDPYVINIVAVSGTETSKVPVVFLHERTTPPVQFTGKMPQSLLIIGLNEVAYAKSFSDLSAPLAPLLPPGTFDFIAVYDDGALVFKEDIPSDITTPLVFDRAEAENTLSFQAKDEHGNSLSATPNLWGVTFIVSKDFFFIFDDIRSVTVSNLKKYDVSWELAKVSPVNSSVIYDISASSPIGVSKSQVFSNAPAELTEVSVMNPNLVPGAQQNLQYFEGFATVPPIKVANPFTIMHSQNAKLQHPALLAGNLFKVSSLDGSRIWETNNLTIDTDQSVVFKSVINAHPLATSSKTNSFEYVLGGTLPHVNGRVFYNDRRNEISYAGTFSFGIIDRSYGERENGLVDITLIDNADQSIVEHRISSNRFFSDRNFPGFFSTTTPPRGSYTLKFQYNDYMFQGQPGVMKVSSMFNTLLPDPLPPQLLSFDLFNEKGFSTNTLNFNEYGTVQLQITDACDQSYSTNCITASGIASVILEYKKSDATTWTTVAMDLKNERYGATLPRTLPGSYSLRLTATDNSGNQLQQTIEPAYVVNATPNVSLKKAVLVTPTSGSRTAVTPQFVWLPMAAASTFTLNVSTTQDFTSLVADVTQPQNSVVLPRPLNANTKYYWRVRGNTPTSSGAWSDVNTFTTDGPFRLPLVAPLHGSVNQPWVVHLEWEDIQANGYVVSIAEDTLFRDTPEFSGTNSFTFSGDPGKTYYWKVRPLPEPISWESEIFSFTTAEIALEIVSPSDQAQHLPVNVTFEWEPLENVSFYALILSDSPPDGQPVTFGRNIATTSNRVVIPDLDPNKNYKWIVKIHTLGGDINSSSLRRFDTQNAPPSSPTTLVAQGGHREVTLLWAAVPEENIISYNIYSGTGASATLVATVPATTTTFVDAGLNNGTTYFYQVSAVNTSGEGAKSVIASATPMPPFVTLSPSTLNNIPALGQTGTVSVTSNTDWAALPMSDGVTISNVTHTSFDYTVAENFTFNDRSMAVTVMPTGTTPGISQTLVLNQHARPYIVADVARIDHIPLEGGSYFIGVTSNYPGWFPDESTLPADVSLNQITPEGFFIEIPMNPLPSSREFALYLNTNPTELPMTRTVITFQQEANTILTLSEYTINNIPASGTSGWIDVASHSDWSAFSLSDGATVSTITSTSFKYSVGPNPTNMSRSLAIEAFPRPTPWIHQTLVLNQLPAALRAADLPAEKAAATPNEGEDGTVLFPNPSHGILNIKLPGEEPARITVWNIYNTLIYQEEHSQSEFAIELEAPEGLYLVEIKQGRNTKLRRLLLSK